MQQESPLCHLLLSMPGTIATEIFARPFKNYGLRGFEIELLFIPLRFQMSRALSGDPIMGILRWSNNLAPQSLGVSPSYFLCVS